MLKIITNTGVTRNCAAKLEECVTNTTARLSTSNYMPESRNKDAYIPNGDQGVLYSVSQHVPVNTGYRNPCIVGNYSRTWKKMAESDDTRQDSLNSDKQTTDSTNTISSAATATVHSLGAASGGSDSTNAMIPTCVYLMSRVALHMDIEDTQNTNADIICQAIINCDELGLNRQQAPQIFTLWLCSPLLELQLKPHHKPYQVKKSWRSLLEQYSHGSFNQKQRDEPVISFQRNIFYSQQLEEKIKDQKLIELLYEETKYNILEGRYPCETAHYIMLGGIQARIELGPYNLQVHSTHYFREEQAKYLPAHVRKSSTWTWLPISSKNSAEVRLLEQFKRIPTSATNRKLMRKYLEFCWSLPYYG